MFKRKLDLDAVKKLLTKRGKSLTWLAEQMECSRAVFYSRWSKGGIPIYAASNIAKLLKCKIDDIVFDMEIETK